MNRRALSWLFSLPFLLLSAALVGQDDENEKQKQSIFDVFYQKGLIKAELASDFALLEENKNTENYQPAAFAFEDKRGKKQEWNIEIRPRGKFRRRVCQFVPIKMKFDKDELKSVQLKKHNELKLVAQCLNNSKGKEYILREFLVYKLYEIISPVHFRAQIARIKFYDTGQKKVTETHYAIILEDEKELAARLNSKDCEQCFNLPQDSFNVANAYHLALFQYMIANTDWSASMLRNVLVLRSKKAPEYFVAPYDFDFSGLVNASYAIPDPTYRLTSLRERKFLGAAYSEEDLRAAADHFLSKKKEIIDCIMDFDLLSKSSRVDIREFVKSFFLDLEGKRFFLAAKGG